MSKPNSGTAIKRDRASRNAWSRVRICDTCEKIESIRRDNKASTCRSCAAKISGAKGIATIKSRARATVRLPRPSRRAQRTCQNCASSFSVPQSVLSSKTNSAGNFCSRPCYNAFLARTPRVRGRGSAWSRIAATVRRRFPFCAVCGSIRKLQVHHIVPYRLTRDNSEANLIPLCVAHHREIETITCTFEAAWDGNVGSFAPLAFYLRSRQNALAQVLRRICR